tara:strand:+ start:3923 stop:4360 length:438 start_codon:yes stop_codon:yes gene_type:complete
MFKKHNNRKGKGLEDEVPFLLKKRLENQGIYEPGIISQMLKDVTRNTVKAAMSRKHLMDSYKQYREEKKLQADSMKKKFEKNKERIAKINILLKDKKTLLTDSPSTRTRSKSKSRTSNQYRELISEKERLVNENYSITYILNRRF